MKKQAPVVPQRQFVAFRLGEIEFGVDVFSVHEILKHRSVASLPRAPAFVEGMVELRGAVIPVVDLRRRFEVADPRLDSETRIMVVDLRGERLGLIVDRVTEVLRVPETALAEPPAYLRGRTAEALTGIARTDERMILLLDLEKVLTTEERLALEELEAALAEAPAEAEQGSTGERDAAVAEQTTNSGSAETEA